jgi:CHRD domain
MRKSVRGLSIFAVVALLLTTVAFSQAQEVTEEPTQEMTTEPMAEATQDASSAGTQPGMIACSSDLIVQLYIAERYFDFSAMNDQWMQSGTSTLDLTQFDKGQFAPWFDTRMSMSGQTSNMSAEQSAAITEMMLMDDAIVSNEPLATMLTPPMFADEMTECAMLRTTLNRFFVAVASQDMNVIGAGAEATADASTDATGSTRENVSFSTTLSGSAEVPGPGDPDGTGTAAVTFDFANSQICYDVSVQNLTLPAAAMHIHSGNSGEGGPVVVPFDKAPDESGNATGCVLVSDMSVLSQIADSPAGFYVNVHTSDFPDGAVRGQVAG